MGVSLYNKQLMSHHKAPVGFIEKLSLPFQTSQHNAFCGDEITLGICLSEQTISEIQFSGENCAVCRAAASLLCSEVNGIEIDAAQQLVREVRASLTEDKPFPSAFAALKELQHYPVRKQCALLPFQALSCLFESHISGAN